MKVYVGYILSDYTTAVFMSTKREKVRKALDECDTRNSKWIEAYNIDSNNLIKLKYN